MEAMPAATARHATVKRTGGTTMRTHEGEHGFAPPSRLPDAPAVSP